MEMECMRHGRSRAYPMWNFTNEYSVLEQAPARLALWRYVPPRYRYWNGVDGIYLVSTKIPLSQHGLHVALTVRGPRAQE